MNIRIVFSVLLCVAFFASPARARDVLLSADTEDKQYTFGVYLGSDDDMLYRLTAFEKVVIRPEYFDASEIQYLRDTGTRVFAYISAATVVEGDSLYAEYRNETFKKVTHHAGERYVNVATDGWVDDVVGERVDPVAQGVDGIYFSRFEVYTHKQKKKTAQALLRVLKKTRAAYPELFLIVENASGVTKTSTFKNANYTTYVDGISKTSVNFKPDYSAEDNGQDTYVAQKKSKRKAAIKRLKQLKNKGLDIYLIDYTNKRDQYESVLERSENRGFVSFVTTRDMDTVLWYGGLESAVAGRPFASSSVWNMPIDAAAAIDEHSSEMIATMYNGHSDNKIYINVDWWTIPLYYVHSGMPTRTVTCVNCGPGYATTLRVPDTAQSDPTTDGLMSIIDLDLKRSYELFQAERVNESTWAATSGFSFDLTGSGIQAISSTSTSPRGAGMSVTGGIIRREEIIQGVIPHALAMAYDYPKKGYFVYPASAEDGRSEEEYAIPEGARIQLDPEVDIDSLGLSRAGKIIARALQEYGAYIVDNADGIAIYAEGRYAKDVSWEGVLANEDVIGIPLSSLRVLELGEPLTNPYLE